MLIPRVKDLEQIAKNSSKPLTITQDTSASQAAEKMNKHNVGCLLVIDKNDKLIGVLTERDMLAKVLAASLSSNTTLAKEIMTTNPISCTMETSLAEIEQLMAKNKIRNIPVLKNEKPVSMISSRDIIAYQLNSNKAMKTAAEQLAMLSTGLKSLDFDDVIELAINEVPKSFGAEHAVLCFAPKDSGDKIISRKNCQISEESLLKFKKEKQTSQDQQISPGQPCQQCLDAGGTAPKIVIPLTICENGHSNDDSNDKDPAIQGFLCMCKFNASSKELDKSQLYKASLLKDVLNINLTNAKLYQDYQKARHESEIDPLTGVGTRRVFDQVLKVEYARAKRYHRHFSVAIVDVDKFKIINDTAGHATGDRALQQLAHLMRENIRETDIIITRYGGDEFVLLMPETNLDGAIILLERLREQAGTITIREVGQVTTSTGIAEFTDDDSPESLMSRADNALYEAKRQGRNRVITAQPAV